MYDLYKVKAYENQPVPVLIAKDLPTIYALCKALDKNPPSYNNVVKRNVDKPFWFSAPDYIIVNKQNQG